MSALLQADVVVMGVSGVGKSAVGTALAERLRARFIDADDLHSDAARAQMASGTPLTDADRLPWLERVAARLRGDEAITVVACSALRRQYRDVLRAGDAHPLFFVHLSGDAGLVASRLDKRAGHFMPPVMLASQLGTLEPLAADEAGAVVLVDGSIAEVVEAAVQALADAGLLADGA